MPIPIRGDLAPLVVRFKKERPYPTEGDEGAWKERAKWRVNLERDALRNLDNARLRQLGTNDGGAPGVMANFFALLKETDGPERLRGAIDFLLFGPGNTSSRLDELFDGPRKLRGVQDVILTKILSLGLPEEWLPVFPYDDDNKFGKLNALTKINLSPPPASDSRGSKMVDANARLREKLAPHFGTDTWGMMAFLFWLLGWGGKEEITDDVMDFPTKSIVPEDLAALARSLLIDAEYLHEVDWLLRDKKQMIFYGPPGTGKTYLARKLAEFYSQGENETVIIQFHPSYAYEDFMHGYRPHGSDGHMTFALVDGPLKRIAAKAISAPKINHVLVIDEINRSNLAKVFGELFYLLEYRDKPVNLQYSNEPFSLPKNLWIIGTMNTADRSIALIDAALRRRFHFVPFFPDQLPIQGLLLRWLELKKPALTWIAGVVDRANLKLGNRHVAIGPSHFMRDDLDKTVFDRVWRHSVLPYVEEQFFDQWEQSRDDFDWRKLTDTP